MTTQETTLQQRIEKLEATVAEIRTALISEEIISEPAPPDRGVPVDQRPAQKMESIEHTPLPSEREMLEQALRDRKDAGVGADE
jgi:hypothetical protein